MAETRLIQMWTATPPMTKPAGWGPMGGFSLIAVMGCATGQANWASIASPVYANRALVCPTNLARLRLVSAVESSAWLVAAAGRRPPAIRLASQPVRFFRYPWSARRD
jgi:hypothetical protein